MTEPSFKDRSGALIAMGVFEILGSVLMALFSGLMVAALLMTPSGYPLSYGLISVAMYAAISIWFLVMGIGTIRGSRWARMLMLSASWFSLLAGITAMLFVTSVFPKMFSGVEMGKEAIIIAAITVGVTLSTIYLLLPLTGILFYSGRNVRATCEHRHPVPSWTERCPLPVLILVLLMFTSACSGLMQTITNFIYPFFGTLLSGTPGLTAWITNGAVCLFIAAGLYKQKPAAWWGVLVYYALFMLSNILTFSRITMADFYRIANYPESLQIQMQQSGWMDEMWFIKIGLLAAVPTLIYLLFIKRYFEQPEPEEC